MKEESGQEPRFWRSLAELEDDQKFVEHLAREFPEQADVLSDPPSRRNFMQLMGASLALAGMSGAAGCRWEEEDIVPLSRNPSGMVPGVPRQYATAMELSGAAAGLLVTSYDGRPIKIEGNPDHPFNGGRTSAFAQASILSMYDPDRSEKVIRRARGRAVPSTWEDFDALADGLAKTTRLHVLSEPTSSPTVARLRKLLEARFAGLRWHEWEPLSRDNEREGMRLAFGTPYRPLLHLDRANIIVALDADVLVDHPAAVRYARDFAARRRPEDGPMSRLYSIESAFSHTGAMSDHRLPLRSELILPFLRALESQLVGGAPPAAPFLSDKKVSRFLGALAEDLRGSSGAAVLVAGPRQPPVVHALVARLNRSAGEALEYLPDPDESRKAHEVDIAELTREMQAGQVETLLVIGGNPVYDAPADLGFERALARVGASIHLSEYQDETSHACTWHLPRAHYLEAWGDGRAYDGTYTLMQPLLEPLKGGRSAVQILAGLAGLDAKDGQKLVRDTFAERFFGGLDPEAATAMWRRAVHDGFVDGERYKPVGQTTPGTFDVPTQDLARAQIERKNGELEVVFTSSSHTYDGRFANNAWLQESPDFMTKLVWDNAALISPLTARRLGIKQNDLIRINLAPLPGARVPVSSGSGATPEPIAPGEPHPSQPRRRSVEVVAHIMPGQAAFSIALALGHGRTRAGVVGGMAERTYRWDGDDWVSSLDQETPGFDLYPLRRSQALYVETGASVERVGTSYPLSGTQDHWAMIDERGTRETQKRIPDLVVMATAEEAGRPGFKAAENHGFRSLYKRQEVLTAKTTTRRWGMATDLSTCTGCNACVLACQAENNVPVVGKREVYRSREMHWIRIDRYFKGDPESPEIAHQPVACQQCENAPCEEVCPVGATVHSDEGLNDMVYNRCIGTRYCLNNCPYKVRRFNYFHWHKHSAFQDPDEPRNQIRRLLFNPEVTVRSRGVMEKCTFCVQRIERVKIAARNDGDRPIRDGEVTPACAQACPTDSIVFGDLADPESRVSKLHQLGRKYGLLPELNTFPRNAYLARVKNPNPRLK